ncbi:MAG TPA: hypothetical protein VFE58_01345 [Tepidisphaeraceae bacterium]|jgi:hypothetical protein|nr:hypothetical protein [Tepidisphaeraceae bacterium]
MRVPLKLSEIDREHLQELYDTAGVPRDQLPYSEKYDEIWQGFQDRTFKNADREQIFGAILKYTRTGTKNPANLPESELTPEQIKQIKGLLNRHAKGGKILPYSEEFTKAKEEFVKLSKVEGLEDGGFWVAVLHATGAKRKPPVRAKAKAAVVESDDEGDDE